LFNEDNKSGGNKLRTYRKLKTQFDLENYLCAAFKSLEKWQLYI
jgi:hypothetical protein